MAQDDTDSDGVVTTGIGGASDGAVDESGNEGDAAPHYCIYSNNPNGLEGIRHQCNMEYDLDISFKVTPLIGAPFEKSISISGVQTLNDSTYERPFVMACCTDITEAPGWPYADSCTSAHHRPCFSDFIEHICAAPGDWLERAALEHSFDGKMAIEAASKWFNDHRNDCYQHFWSGPDALDSLSMCSPDLDGKITHTPWKPGKTWSYVIDEQVLATVSDVEIKPTSWLGTAVPHPPPASPATCMLPDQNDSVAPPFPQQSKMGMLVHPVSPAPIGLTGPELAGEVITGAGDLGPESLARWTLDDSGPIVLTSWMMTGSAPTEAGNGSWSVDVEHFTVALIGGLHGDATGGEWEADAETAAFNLGAKVDGVAYSIQAANATPIQLQIVSGGTGGCPTQAASCLFTGPFSIAYQDAIGQDWILDLPSVIWSP